MVWTGRAERTQHAAVILVKTGAALDEIFRYYKFERYGSTFPDKPYFLLSHCAHLLFSLWLAEQDSEGGIFRQGPQPAAFTAGLDFASLRYADYNRRTIHGEALEEHLKNEPKWFEFWMKALERLDPPVAASIQEFSRQVLAHAGLRSFLDGRKTHRNHRALNQFLETDEAGRVLLRTIAVLEDMICTIAHSFVDLTPRTCLIEQLTALTCLLGQIRRVIVCETPARGPCVPSGIRGWGMPWPLARIRCAGTQGTLAVVPKRNGGDIVCTYTWTSRAQTCSRTWTVKASALSLPYEQELFGTWSYNTGEHLHDPRRFAEVRACWTVQTTEASRLEETARRVDPLLRTLSANPLCQTLVGSVTDVLRNGSPCWKPVELPWTYLKGLDRLLSRLTFACREARVLGGDDSAEVVIRQVWPSPAAAEAPQERTASPSCDADEPGVNQSEHRPESVVRSDRQEPARSDGSTGARESAGATNGRRPCDGGPAPSSALPERESKPSRPPARRQPMELLLERILRPRPAPGEHAPRASDPHQGCAK